MSISTKDIENRIFSLHTPSEWNRLALDIFKFQYEYIPAYKKFVDSLDVPAREINHYSAIPFMPVEFFKNHRIIPSGYGYERVFRSSGTTGIKRSTHYVHKLTLYERSVLNSFRHFYGEPEDYLFLALLPSYLERDDASLVYMMDFLIRKSKYKESGFYLKHNGKLREILQYAVEAGIPVILVGVTFALLDFALQNPANLSHVIIMETGGMKGRGKEPVKTEVHQILKDAFHVDSVHSEYGMTELLSQAYSKGNNLFRTPPWMKILIRDVNDPLSLVPPGKTGGINIIDFANLYSCSFIATKDIGKITRTGEFEVLGRFDHSDIRGCNLLLY